MADQFPILAIETTGELCSAAVLFDERNYAEINYLQKHIHSQKLIDIIDALLKTSGVELKDIKSIAVSMGPGSFTGLRIGLSAVKGIAFGANLPIIPVPTFDAFALQLSKNLPDASKFIIALTASIDDFYFSKYQKRDNKVNLIEELKLLKKPELKIFVEDDEIVFGNVDYENILNAILAPYAHSIGLWAYLFGNDLLTFNYDYLEPNYFKKFIVKVKL